MISASGGAVFPAAKTSNGETLFPRGKRLPANTMAKTQNSQKQTKKKPLKTPAEKKAAKREKKGK
jgi:hypothetical protein